MTPAGDVSYSQKKHAMNPGFYSFRALGMPMIEDYSCCHFARNIRQQCCDIISACSLLLPQELTQQCRNIAEHPTTSITRVQQNEFFTKYFWYLLLTYNYCHPTLLEWVFFWACTCISRSVEINEL